MALQFSRALFDPLFQFVMRVLTAPLVANTRSGDVEHRAAHEHGPVSGFGFDLALRKQPSVLAGWPRKTEFFMETNAIAKRL